MAKKRKTVGQQQAEAEAAQLEKWVYKALCKLDELQATIDELEAQR